MHLRISKLYVQASAVIINEASTCRDKNISCLTLYRERQPDENSCLAMPSAPRHQQSVAAGAGEAGAGMRGGESRS